MATLTFRTATTGLRPRSDHATVHGRRTLKTEPEALSPRAKQINERELQRFRCRWPETNRGQRELLRQAWRESRGGVLPMNYTPIDDIDANAIEVQIVTRPREVQRGPVTFELECELVEVR